MNIVKWFKRREEIRRWCYRMQFELQLNTPDFPEELPPPPDGYEKNPEAVEYEKLRQEALSKMEQRTQEAAKEASDRLNDARAIEDETEQHAALLEFTRTALVLLRDEDFRWYRARLRELTITRTNQLIQEAREGDPSVLYEAYSITIDTPEVLPEDWNELVATMIKAPPLHLFQRDWNSLSYEEYHLLVAEALRRRSLTECKLLLACSRHMIHGEANLRVGELADLIIQLHEELGLFQ